MKGGGPPWQSVVALGSSPKSTWIWRPSPSTSRVAALADVASPAREGVLALSVACGLQVIAEMMVADVDRICGPKGKHDADRTVYRHGTEERLLPLGDALVKTDRPRARTTEGREVRLPTWEVFSRRDLLSDIALGRMLAGLSARRYRAGSEPVGEVELHGTSRSAISRRFRRAIEAKLAELFHRDLSKLRLLAVFIDGIHVGGHVIVVALGVDEQGRKHPLGLWEGTTENKTTCSALIDNLIGRRLPEERALLFVIDGARRSAGRSPRIGASSPWCNDAVSTSRSTSPTICRTRSERSSPESSARCGPRPTPLRPNESSWRWHRLWSPTTPAPRPRSARGLEETLTITRLGLPPSLWRTFKTTNPIESMISIGRHATRNVKRWRDGKMALRWIAMRLLAVCALAAIIGSV